MYKSALLLCVALASLIPGFVLGLYDNEPSILSVTDVGTFRKRILQTKTPVLVEFYQAYCGWCKKFAPIYSQAAKKLKGKISVYAINNLDIMRLEKIKGYPTVRLYLPGKKPVEFTQERTVSGIMQFLKYYVPDVMNDSKKDQASSNDSSDHLPIDSLRKIPLGKLLKTVQKDKNFAWFIMFHDSKCKVSKKWLSNWNSIATRVTSLYHSTKFGYVELKPEDLKKEVFKNRKTPIFAIFPEGDKTIMKKYRPKSPEMKSLSKFVAKYANIFRPKQLLSEDKMQEKCSDTTCILAFLPNMLENTASQRNSYIKILKDVQLKQKALRIRYYWVEGGADKDAEEQLNLNFGYPAVIATHLHKNRYAILKGSYKLDTLNEFVISLSRKGATTLALPPSFEITKFAETWDGKDLLTTTPSPADEYDDDYDETTRQKKTLQDEL